MPHEAPRTPLLPLKRSSRKSLNAQRIWLAVGLAVATVGSLPPAVAETRPDPQGPSRPDLSETDRARVKSVTAPTRDFTKAESFEQNSAGAATSRKRDDRFAFSHPLTNLTPAQEQDFRVGNGLFKKMWTSSPSSTQASDGLGPLYNARSCQSCHLKGGRGRPPVAGEPAVSLLMRLSIPPQTAEDETLLADRTILTIPEPTYGKQLQGFAVSGLQGEAQLKITIRDLPVTLADGEIIHLQEPLYELTDLGYGPMHPDAMMSPRVTPPMIGLGLLEAIHPNDILANADPKDTDGDGISGRPNWVRDPASGEKTLGRFGWKATNPTIHSQAAEAFLNDIGIATPDQPILWGDCTQAQAACRRMHHGEQDRLGPTEAPDPVLDLVAFHSANIAVPSRRDVGNPFVLRGKQLFYETGCTSCHRPKYVTRRDADTEAHRFQLIWPYTDMLLHDMGEGLADRRPAGDASGQEWRTPPLWGIGLTETVNGHARFLHDGRARNLLEAILWHGGEAKATRDAVVAMPKTDRDALITFLESL